MANGSKKKSKETRKIFQVNENKNSTYQIIWDAGRAVVREKFIAVNINIYQKKYLISLT